MAEVLITLGIIGVVAVLVLPAIFADIQDKQYAVARKKALKTIGEAGRLIIVNNEFGQAYNAQELVDNYLSKYLKIVKSCPNNKLTSCGLPAKIIRGNEEKDMPKQVSSLSYVDTNLNGLREHRNLWPSHGFLTADGFAVDFFYNYNCNALSNVSATRIYSNICMYAIYDMNGLKGPNIFGKDLGVVAVFGPNPDTSVVVAPSFNWDNDNVVKDSLAGGGGVTSWNNAIKSCKGEYYLPSIYELMALAKVTTFASTPHYYTWSSTPARSGAHFVSRADNVYIVNDRSAGYGLVCLKFE